MTDLKHQIKLKPWRVPNFAIAELSGEPKEMSIPIHQLSDETLEAMCKNFRDALFAKKVATPNPPPPSIEQGERD